MSDEDESDLLENVQALIEKERRLMELQLLEKEKELNQLRETVSLEKRKNQQRESKFRDPQDVSPQDWAASGQFGDDFEDEEGGEDHFAEYRAENQPGMGNQIQDLGDPSTFASMERLSLRDQALNEASLAKLASALVFAPSVKVLDVSKNNLGDTCAASVAGIVAHRKIGLEVLNISENRFHLPGAKVVCSALSRNQTLKMLDMSQNPFMDDPESGKTLGTLIGQGTSHLGEVRVTLRDPKRDRNSMTKRGNTSMFLVSILGSHCNVASIGLVQNQLPKAAISVLCSEGLAKAYLLKLDLSMAFIGSSGAIAIAKAVIKANRDLGTLSTTDARYLSKLRTSSRSHFHLLEELVLKMNAIGPSASPWLARLIGTSSTLRKLDLSCNDLNDYSVKALAEGLEKTKAPMEELNLTRNPVFSGELEVGAKKLKEVLKVKRTLRSLGPKEDLMFSIHMKRKLLKLLNSNVLQPTKGGTGSESKNDGPTNAVLFQQRERRSLLDFNDLTNQEEGEEEERARFEIAELRIPPSLGLLERDSNGIVLFVEWESSPGMEWRILRERRERVYGEPDLSVVSVGDSGDQGSRVRSEDPADRIRFWHRYKVETDGWVATDKMILEIRPARAVAKDGTAFIQNITISSALSDTVILDPISTSLANPNPAVDANFIVLHSKAYRQEFVLEINNKMSNTFKPINGIYVHGGTRSGKMLLTWNVKLETLDGKTLKNRDKFGIMRNLGADWKISKNGSNHQVLSGSANENRVVENSKSKNRDDEEFTFYSVDLSNLYVFVGDTLTLSLRPPQAALSSNARHRRLYRIVTSQLRLILDVSKEKDVAYKPPTINLAGPNPFKVTHNPFAWA